MTRRSRSARRLSFNRLAALAVASLLVTAVAGPSTAIAQGAAQTGTIAGRVVDERGTAVAAAQVTVERTGIGTETRPNGEYLLSRVPVGNRRVRVRLLGFRPDSANVVVASGQRAVRNFSLVRDPLQLQTLVVTATQRPRIALETSVAATTLSPQEIQQAAPRSTTEALRYVPGFTRVESSGGEVNQNITMRGILGVEYVMFMEDGLPVFPTMHTFFMNADNLFRVDENLERLEVVRGGSSSLFGSNTPGAIVNLLNKTGGDEFRGSMRAAAATEGLARYDLNANGPLGQDWRFNVGGFYRYDHGVRDPGFPGTRGGQLKGSITRLLANGYVRGSVKIIDDRNQFILPLPFTNPVDPQYVPGFSDYGAMNTNEALDLRVPIPTGDLTLPLDNGLRTSAQWFTADAAFDLPGDWRIQNTAQFMQNEQEWNALVPSNVLTVDQFLTSPRGQAGLGMPAGTAVTLTYTNQLAVDGTPLPYDNPNGLIAPGELIHVDKPLSAFQDQLQLSRTFGRHALSLGAYFATYSQENRWNFTQILMDVRDNPRFLDAVVTAPGGTPTTITSNGFRNFLSGYANGSGQASVLSGVIGGEIQLTDRLRFDLGARVEYNNFVQSAENTSTFDLDGDTVATPFDKETFGNGSFRHFDRDLTDWAASLGANYQFGDNFAVFATAARGFKMPALDEFLNATAAEQVALFEPREVQSIEGGIKGTLGGRVGYTLNGFYAKLKNIVSQGLVVDSVTGGSAWVILTSPENRSYGVEVELVANLFQGLQLFGSGTFLEAELGSGAGADIGSRINGVPPSIGNVAAIYTIRGFGLKADWHWVASRFVDVAVGTELPSYNYFNFGASYTFTPATAVYVDLLNAFQSKGLEEGNPRLLSTGGTGLFLARPLLPRRVTVGLRYDFGSQEPEEF